MTSFQPFFWYFFDCYDSRVAHNIADIVNPYLTQY